MFNKSREFPRLCLIKHSSEISSFQCCDDVALQSHLQGSWNLCSASAWAGQITVSCLDVPRGVEIPEGFTFVETHRLQLLLKLNRGLV